MIIVTKLKKGQYLMPYMDSLVSWDFMTLGFVAYKQRLLAAQVWVHMLERLY